MALTYYELTFDGGSKYIVGLEISSIKDVLNNLSEGLISGNHIQLRYKEGEPLFIRKNRLFSVQKVKPQTIGKNTRIWSLTT